MVEICSEYVRISLYQWVRINQILFYHCLHQSKREKTSNASSVSREEKRKMAPKDFFWNVNAVLQISVSM